MKLFASRKPNNTIAKQIDVFDKDGVAFIRKTLMNDKVLEWECPGKTAAEWVAFNNTKKKAAAWEFA